MALLNASVIVLTKNGEETIGKCLEGVFSQKSEHQFEVIIIDSGSTDATLDIVSGYDVRLIRIKPENFHNAKTRNHGARISRGEYLIFITQDAWPTNAHWMDSLLSNFTTNQIAGVFGKQIPLPVANSIIQRQLSIYYGNTRRINKKCNRMTFQTTFLFSNVNSAIRKKIWQIHPFDEDRVYAEDLEWATGLILNGYQTIYDPSAAVYHSHNNTLRIVLKRSYHDGRSHKRIFRDKYRLSNIIRNSLRTFLRTANPTKDTGFVRKNLTRRSFIRGVLFSLAYRTAQSIGYLLGYLDFSVFNPYLSLYK